MGCGLRKKKILITIKMRKLILTLAIAFIGLFASAQEFMGIKRIRFKSCGFEIKI